MYLLISIISSAILGLLLFMLGPIFGGLIAFGIIVGCLFRGLYLLSAIHQQLSQVTSNETEVSRILGREGAKQ
ncbi:hypothetical protein [Gracilibacillus salinarum]|uniref:Uncharacterized protein n=1 Tax=Gracilibacillus salinarum TaxID=2932255 RepID=A0ABY4GS62_9BACI|nr:hypothetical protein [Gracilibacillus salinarum]UOQ87236.1 hypothetical protein MUN87_10270 [Gracilibacillus salinarum]